MLECGCEGSCCRICEHAKHAGRPRLVRDNAADWGPHSEPEYSDSDMDWDALDKTPSGRQTKARYEQEDYRRKSKDRYTPWDSTRHEMRFERRRRSCLLYTSPSPRDS